ncbi:MAG: aspartyl/asparaginyl beta-hydroxylase domain-containing protein [Flavobacteriales bacterium]|nr:aspartyl/asparaginyl beta-hydroxylase domain-containing protein [Flavobacteriales bacterium]
MLKKRTELPNFKKIGIKVDPIKLLNCFTKNNYTMDNICTTLAQPYLNDRYKQKSITTPSEKVLYKNGEEDERAYGEMRPEYKGTYVEEVLNMFKSPYTRVRLIVKEPGAFIKPHIDYNTTYSVRYYIPLQTNEWAYTAVKSKFDKEPEVRHLPADGSVWFVNPGNLHSAWNMGETDDVRLIVSCNGQEDLF